MSDQERRKVYGYDCYVRDGWVEHIVKRDNNGGLVAAAAYRAVKTGGWDKEMPIKLSSMRSGLRRGTVIVS